MRAIFKPFFFEAGFYIVKRYSFKTFVNDLLHKDKYKFNELEDQGNMFNNDDTVWIYNVSIEKRLHVITGYNISKKQFDDRGLLHWLFRDTDIKCLEYKYESLLVIDSAFLWIKKWRNTLINSGANVQQIDIFNMCASELFLDTLNRIYERNIKLYSYITNNFYGKSVEYMILLEYSKVNNEVN